MRINGRIGIHAFFTTLVAAASLAAQTCAAATPVAKKSEETPLRPLAFVICAFEGDGAGLKCAEFGGSPTYTTPPNRTLIIEQVTGFCAGDESVVPVVSVQLNVVTNGAQVDHLLRGSKPEGPGLVYTISDDTRIYADADSTITVGIADIPVADGTRYCRLAFSGRLVR